MHALVCNGLSPFLQLVKSGQVYMCIAPALRARSPMTVARRAAAAPSPDSAT